MLDETLTGCAMMLRCCCMFKGLKQTQSYSQVTSNVRENFADKSF